MERNEVVVEYSMWRDADMTKILPTDSPFAALVKSIKIPECPKELSAISKDELDEMAYQMLQFLVYDILPKEITDHQERK